MSAEIDALQQMAVERCPAEKYYDLLDCLDELSSDELAVIAGVSCPNIMAFLDLYEDCQTLSMNGSEIDQEDSTVHPFTLVPNSPFVTLQSTPPVILTFGDIEFATIDVSTRTVWIARDGGFIKIHFH